MGPDERHEAIMRHLLSAQSADLDTLVALCAVSRMTIHRDLDAMADAGLLRKVRGGATLTPTNQIESSYRYRAQLAPKDKLRIAHCAAQMIEPGMTLMLDDGSTAAALADHLAPHAPLTVITASLPVTIALVRHAPSIKVIQLGGTYMPRYEGFAGPMTTSALGSLRADVALLSSSAIKGGTVFHQEMEMAQTKRAMLTASDRAVLMADPAKFGKTALSVCAELSEFDALLTTDMPPEATVKALEATNCSLVLASEVVTNHAPADVQELRG